MHDWTEHNPLSVFVWGAVKHPGKPRDKIRENIFRTTYQISLTLRVHPYHTCNERITPACSFRGDHGNAPTAMYIRMQRTTAADVILRTKFVKCGTTLIRVGSPQRPLRTKPYFSVSKPVSIYPCRVRGRLCSSALVGHAREPTRAEMSKGQTYPSRNQRGLVLNTALYTCYLLLHMLWSILAGCCAVQMAFGGRHA